MGEEKDVFRNPKNFNSQRKQKNHHNLITKDMKRQIKNKAWGILPLVLLSVMDACNNGQF